MTFPCVMKVMKVLPTVSHFNNGPHSIGPQLIWSPIQMVPHSIGSQIQDKLSERTVVLWMPFLCLCDSNFGILCLLFSVALPFYYLSLDFIMYFSLIFITHH